MTGAAAAASTHLHDLPEVILINIFALVGDVRSRNAMSLVSGRWYSLERSTRTSLALRGNVRDLFLLPACFLSVTSLDLSLLSPWGHPFLHDPPPHPGSGGGAAADHLLLARRLRQAFPNLTSLTVYARTPATLEALAPQWPMLRHAALVRWHQRPDHPLGSDLDPLLASCPSLSSLDLSRFYCWAADLPPALHAHPAAAASLSRLDLLNAASSDGFRSSELVSIAHACPNLRQLLVPCVFNPRYLDFVGDAALLAVASHCPRLTTLHIADQGALSAAHGGGDIFGAAPVAVPEDAGITPQGMEALFAALPLLEDLAVDLCHKVPNSGPALEALSYKCPRIRSLKLGCFQGICIAAGLHLDGVAVCGGLESLCIKNCPDLSDASLVAIARGCRRLSKLEIQRCDQVSVLGIKKLAGMLRSTLVDVSISDCRSLDANLSLQSLEPIRDRIERLHIDCEWIRPENKQLPESLVRAADADTSTDEFDEQEIELKKCRYSDRLETSHLNNGYGSSSFWFRTWDRLRFLSVWVPVGEVLTPLTEAGLQVCPVLEEISIKVEGDCRNFGRPTQLFGLSYLTSYPSLAKMKLDCSEAIGYALTAPSGQMDLSTWERFYLRGIGDLDLQELDYWPPQDKDVNQRSVSLPATSLIQGCSRLRKLFIHGTMHEHFLRFFLMMPSLRDVQLREDYYPAPENDMSTEMRVGSCSRFEDALNSRLIPP